MIIEKANLIIRIIVIIIAVSAIVGTLHIWGY
jgi:hypothetical protein